MRRLFKKVKNKPTVTESKASSYVEINNGTKVLKDSPTNRSIKERLFANYGEALERIALWLPLFLGAWLSSGFVLEKLTELSLVSIPLIIHFLFRTRKTELKIFLEKEILIFSRFLPYLSALYLYSEMNRADLSICLTLSNLCLELYFLDKEHRSFFLILKALSVSLFMATSSQMGILSQQKFSSLGQVFIGYCILGLIPGTVLTARKLLLSVEQFSTLGWPLGSITKNGKSRPTGYTKLVVFFIILGPAIPAMLLPFDILPKAFISSSLVFFIIPKIAERIQNTIDTNILKTTSIYLVILALGLEVLVFISSIIGI